MDGNNKEHENGDDYIYHTRHQHPRPRSRQRYADTVSTLGGVISKRSRLRLIPSHLPLIRDKIVEKQRKRLKRQHDATQYREALAAAWDEADQMATAQLWWISRDMAKLAADTAAVGDYPKNRPPAASGVMIIDGGLPVDASPVGFKANINGFFWVVSGGETTVYPMTDDPETLEKTGAADAGLPVDLMIGSGALADAADANAALLHAWVDFAQAVWALSEETRICQAKPGEPSAVHPLPSRFDPEIRKVKMLVLRENLHRPGESADDDGRVRREYSHRFIVRGFWRDQAYGPNHSLRRRQWIPPFVKGPADKPLICKETVRIWRR